MLYEPERHEPLAADEWDERLVRETIARIVRTTDAQFTPDAFWPLHPLDVEPGDDVNQPAWPLYYGAAGVMWALHYLQDVGALTGVRCYWEHIDRVLDRNRQWLNAMPQDETASYLLGETPILLMQHGAQPQEARATQLAQLIERNLEHPARELMWGAPGTMLASLFLFERFAEPRWAELFRRSAARLWSQLERSDELGCSYWTQDMYGMRTTYLDAVHGFVATAYVLNRGRRLLEPQAWAEWEDVIATTIERAAVREDGMANWRPQLLGNSAKHAHPHLMQFCHGSPGFVICLANFASKRFDDLLREAGEAVWNAGPLAKGANLCHGTGGNGYAFLKLFQRTGERFWLDRARAFAMHGIAQMNAAEREHGQLRYSLWTGDLGLAIYLWDCLKAQAVFPTLDVFFAPR